MKNPKDFLTFAPKGERGEQGVELRGQKTHVEIITLNDAF